MTRVNPDSLMFLADKETWNRATKTINGARVKLVATQESRRNKRTNYIYLIEGTDIIIHNRSRNGVYFMRMAHRAENMSRYYDIFVRAPLTENERAWLLKYDYKLC